MPPATKPKMPKAALVALVMVSILGIGGIIAALVFSGWLGKNSDRVADVVEEANQTVDNLQKYPISYRQASLPQYPDGEVTYIGNADDTAAEGIFIFVNTSEKLDQVAAWYDRELRAKGWKLTQQGDGDTSISYSRIYQLNDQEYHLGLTRDNQTERTNITIDWRQTDR